MRKIDIDGFENYQITDDGKIWSKKSNKYMKLSDNGNGYLNVQVYENKKHYHLYIHILVANAFIPNPQNKPIVGHKDCNTHNNTVENLYWCTQEENNQHPITRKRRSESLMGRKRDDLKRDALGKFIKKGARN